MTRQGLQINGGYLQAWSFQFTAAVDLAGTSGSGAKTFNLYNLLSGPPFNTSVALAFPVGSWILAIRVKHSVAFAGGSLTAMKVRVGKTGGATNFFVADYDVFQAVADGTLTEVAMPPMGQLSAVTPTVTFTPTGDSCVNVTAGVVNITVVTALLQTPATIEQNLLQVAGNVL